MRGKLPWRKEESNMKEEGDYGECLEKNFRRRTKNLFSSGESIRCKLSYRFILPICMKHQVKI